MKIALELKENTKEEIINRLIKKGYEVDTNSFGCVWVHGLKNIHWLNGTETLVLENGKSIISMGIDFKYVKYFEIHSEEVR